MNNPLLENHLQTVDQCVTPHNQKKLDPRLRGDDETAMIPLITFKNTNLSIPGLEKPILHNINYHINAGDFIILLGSNGSGKSSLMKLIDQRYHASHGEIIFKNLNTGKQFYKHVKTVTQNYDESLFPNLTVLESYLLTKQLEEPTLFAMSEKKERAFLKDYLKRYHAKLPEKLDQLTNQLSGGEKQTLVLALTMLYPPRLLLLDEFTSALDPNAGEQLMVLAYELAQEHHITCILTTHDLAIAARYGNRLLALKNG